MKVRLVRRHRQGVAWHALACVMRLTRFYQCFVYPPPTLIRLLHLPGISLTKANIRIFYLVFVIIEFA